jgi:hypothetical protein
LDRQAEFLYKQKLLEVWNCRKSISTILHIPGLMRPEDGLLPCSRSAGHPQDVEVLDRYAPGCNSQTTKRPELQFRALLAEDGAERLELASA